MPLTLEHALTLAQAALARAVSKNMNVGVAVIDASFHIKAALRSDGAGAPTVDIAYGKARAALSFGCSSRQIADALAGNPLAGPSVLSALPPPLVLLPGGVLIHDDSAIIGAIGVAGGAPDDDEWVAAGR